MNVRRGKFWYNQNCPLFATGLEETVVVKRTWKQEIKLSWHLYILILWSFVLAIIFCYLPMGGIVMAFQDYKPWLGILGSDWVLKKGRTVQFW